MDDTYRFVQVSFRFLDHPVLGRLKQPTGFDSGATGSGVLCSLSRCAIDSPGKGCSSVRVYIVIVLFLPTTYISHHSIWTKYTVAGNDSHT